MLLEFGKTLKELRNERNVTQRELAGLVGLSATGYAGYEQGHREPDLKTLVSLAKFFNVSTDYLLGLKDETGCLAETMNFNQLLPEETELIKTYRALPRGKKARVAAYADILSEKVGATSTKNRNEPQRLD